MNWGELLEQLQDMTENLKGKDIRRMCAADLVMKEAENLPCITHPLSVHDSQLWYDTQTFSEIPVAKFQAQYDKDARSMDGLSYKIREMDISLLWEVPPETEIAQMNRWLQYAVAMERRKQTLNNIEELEQDIASERETASELLAVIEQNKPLD